MPSAPSRVSGPTTSRSDHLPGLDGLRALAVIAVLLFHLRSTWLPGGFLGVDVFFVISGFLITTLLVREHRRTGRLNLPAFWTRRARRLLPALALVVLVAPFVARFVEADLLVGIGRQTVGALTFSTNWLEIGAGSDYFHTTSPQLFMNFWSLAVEEQFYLFWPLATLLIVAFVRRRRSRMWVPLALAGASALWGALLLDPTNITRVYYGTDTHLVGLMLGAALAFAYAAPHQAWTRTSAWRRVHLPLTAWALVILLALFAGVHESSAFTFRVGIPLASLTTAVLVLSVVSTPSWFRTGSQARLLEWVGQRSYGIYLWHWPVILIVGALWPVTPGGGAFLASRALALALTLGIAALSYRFVEVPIRTLGFREVIVRAEYRLSGLTPRGLRLAGTAALVACVAYVLVLATAPRQTSTEAMLATNSVAADAPAAAPGAVAPSDRPAPTDSGFDDANNSTPPDASSTEVDAPAADAEAAVFAMPTGAEIDAYGDSILVGSDPAMRYYFDGIRIDALSNRQWPDALAAVSARGTDNRRAVVLAFGTNAGVDRQVIEETLAVLGPQRMVVLVTEFAGFSRIETDNTVLREIAAAHDNVQLADWYSAVKDTSGQLQSDGIHPSRVGSHLWTKTVRAAFAELSARHTGVIPELPELPIP